MDNNGGMGQSCGVIANCSELNGLIKGEMKMFWGMLRDVYGEPSVRE